MMYQIVVLEITTEILRNTNRGNAKCFPLMTRGDSGIEKNLKPAYVIHG